MWHKDEHESTLRSLERQLANSLLDEALRLLGIAAHPASDITPQARGVGRGRPRFWDRPRSIVAIQAYVARHGSVPTRRTWMSARQAGLPGHATICALFGSMAAAYPASGVGSCTARDPGAETLSA